MIFLIGGTKDSREIAERLLKEKYSLLVTTATEQGKNLLPSHPLLTILPGRLNHKDMEDFIERYSVRCLVDASHPYAEEVSENAMKACENKKIPYLRFERKKMSYENVKKFNSFIEASDWLEKREGNILLTTGSKDLEEFLNIREKLYIRILPVISSLKKCEDLGFSPSRIIALQGPFSKEFNRAFYREYGIKYVVMKDSGETGGTPEKIDAALEEGVEVLLVERPKINYPSVYEEINDIIKEVEDLSSRNREHE